MAIDDPSKYSFGWQDHPLKKSLAKIKRPKLDIIGDPADKFRGDKGSITKGDYSSMLAFDKSLYEPGTASMVRSGDAPPVVPAYAQGWQAPTDRAGLASIESRYNGGGSAHGPNAGLEAARAASANVLAAPIPTMEQMADANAAMTNIANPNIQPVAAPEVSPVAAAPGAPAPAPVPEGTNPHTGGPVSALDDWMARGGSAHTFHQAQVAQGVRPQIDARTTPSPHEGMPTNTDIRAGWGWEPAASPSTGSQGSALAAGGGSAGDPARIQANQQAAAEQARRLAMQQQRLNVARAAVSQSNPNGSAQ